MTLGHRLGREREAVQVVCSFSGSALGSESTGRSDPIEKPSFGGAHTDLETITVYQDALRKLRRGGAQDGHGKQGGQPEDKKQDKALGKERKELLKIVTRHDAQRTETEPFMARIDASIHEADRRFLDMRFQLKEQLTKAEWDAAVVRLNQ
jgi:hypothetical protein